MLATPATALPADDENWAYELKWDGVRVVAMVSDGAVRLIGRSGADMTLAYPELAGLGAALGGVEAVLDGEVVVLGADGRPSFEALAPRMHVKSAAKAHPLAASVPVTYIVFDVLALGDRPTVSLPYTSRRELLEDLNPTGPHWQLAPAITGGGADFLEASRRMEFEGVVAKRLTSLYRPGQRSADWIKIKNLRTQEVVIGGYTAGEGGRAATFGALLLGLPLEERPGGADGLYLTYAGSVGTGFDARALADLTARLRAISAPDSPFVGPVDPRQLRTARWVRPELVGEVAFSGWTDDNRMRHPTWRGLRPDKSPSDVTRES
jgi:bifunctional non-homologous end joining protein LigD